MELISQNISTAPQRSSGTVALLVGAYRACRSGSLSLTAVGTLMIPAALASIAGLFFDRSFITGAPTWMKPLKFAISIGLFSYTVAFMIGKLHRMRRVGLWLGRVIAISLLAELVLIDLQAARHTTSHFNFANYFDTLVFQAMGIFISLILLSTIVLLVASCKERFADGALGWTIRLSLLLALAGMGTGILMTLPTPQQLAIMHEGHRTSVVGAHTVGAPDGGSTTPLLGWSADHGDLRVAHFVGLHAMQVLLLGWGLSANRIGWSQKRRIRLAALIGFSSAVAYSVLLTQAIRGQPLFRIDTITAETWAIWIIYSLIGFFWVRNASESQSLAIRP